MVARSDTLWSSGSDSTNAKYRHVYWSWSFAVCTWWRSTKIVVWGDCCPNIVSRCWTSPYRSDFQDFPFYCGLCTVWGYSRKYFCWSCLWVDRSPSIGPYLSCWGWDEKWWGISISSSAIDQYRSYFWCRCAWARSGQRWCICHLPANILEDYRHYSWHRSRRTFS